MGVQDRTDQLIARLARRSHGVVARSSSARRRGQQQGDRVRDRAAAPSSSSTPASTASATRRPAWRRRTWRRCSRAATGAADGRRGGVPLRPDQRQPPRPVVKTLTERRIEGIETHRAQPATRSEWRGIPTTTVPATLVDLAPSMPTDQLARACPRGAGRFRVDAGPTTPAQEAPRHPRRPRPRHPQ